MNADIKAMLEKPGEYVVSNDGFGKQHIAYAMVRVNEAGECRYSNGRDGCIPNDAWLPHSTAWRFEGAKLVRLSNPDEVVDLDNWRKRDGQA
jgi:hypothetical protein